MMKMSGYFLMAATIVLLMYGSRLLTQGNLLGLLLCVIGGFIVGWNWRKE